MEEAMDSVSVKIEECANMFQDFEVKDMYGFNRGEDFIDVICGCTSYRYGDTVGKLRVYASGALEIECECNPTCHEGIFSFVPCSTSCFYNLHHVEDNMVSTFLPFSVLKPTEFEKHALKETPGRWRSNIWVTIGSEKVPLVKTVLLRYSEVNSKTRPSKRKIHRDEFVKCAKCSKRRRFVVGTEKQYREYHDAEIDGNWECSHYPNGKYVYFISLFILQ